MATSAFSAVADIRYHETSLSTSRLRSLLHSAFADKGYAEEAIAYLAARNATTSNFLGFLLGHFLMRTPDTGYYIILQQTADALFNPFYGPPREVHPYTGTPQENTAIDASIATSPARDGFRRSIGRGSARFFSSQGFRLPRYDRMLKHTPIAILGAGAAGTMMARVLVNAGFLSISVLDQTGRYGGIWNQPNVRGGSKNNPFNFSFEGLYVSEAPGPGETITRFLERVVDPDHSHFSLPLPAVKKAKVLGVEPGDLASRITYSDETGQHILEAPIVINALGLGKPLAPSRVGVMTTDMPAYEAGIRWQQILDERQARALDGISVTRFLPTTPKSPSSSQTRPSPGKKNSTTSTGIRGCLSLPGWPVTWRRSSGPSRRPATAAIPTVKRSCPRSRTGRSPGKTAQKPWCSPRPTARSAPATSISCIP